MVLLHGKRRTFPAYRQGQRAGQISRIPDGSGLSRANAPVRIRGSEMPGGQTFCMDLPSPKKMRINLCQAEESLTDTGRIIPKNTESRTSMKERK